jgi:hypothetical protein
LVARHIGVVGYRWGILRPPLIKWICDFFPIGKVTRKVRRQSGFSAACRNAMDAVRCKPREHAMPASVDSFPERRFLRRVLICAGVICALMIAFKYLVVEQPAISALCESDAPAWWCTIRDLTIRLFYPRIPGIASLVCGVIALLLGGHQSARWWSVAAILLAAPSIVLWGADYAAPGFILGLIRLLRG